MEDNLKKIKKWKTTWKKLEDDLKTNEKIENVQFKKINLNWL